MGYDVENDPYALLRAMDETFVAKADESLPLNGSRFRHHLTLR